MLLAFYAARETANAVRGAGVQTARVKREVLGKTEARTGADDFKLSAASRWLARIAGVPVEAAARNVKAIRV